MWRWSFCGFWSDGRFEWVWCRKCERDGDEIGDGGVRKNGEKGEGKRGKPFCEDGVVHEEVGRR